METKEELPEFVISIVGKYMEELEDKIDKLKNELHELKKKHSAVEKWLNENGIDTSVM